MKDARVKPRPRENGYALVAVLWSLMLLSLISAALIAESRTAARNEAAAWDRLRMETLAESATNLGILALFDAHGSVRLDGSPIPFAFDGAEGEFSIRDELGKADLNAAGADLLEALLRVAGLAPPDAEQLAARIVERRSATKAEAGRPRLPAARLEPRRVLFESVEELRSIPGIDRALFERLRLAVTVHSQVSAIDPRFAPEIVLRALPGMDTAEVDAILKGRSASGIRERNAARAESVPRIPLGGRAFTVSVSVRDGKRSVQRETVVRVTGDPARPYWILETRQI